jgi:hypothetical protein
MPANVRVIHSSDFIRARPNGEADIETAEKLLRDIAQAGTDLDSFEILVDTRHVKGQLSVADLWSLAEKLVRFRRTFSHRTAVLCPLERFDHVRFFTLCAENHGFNIRAFTSYEDAMEWLLSGSN